MSGQKIIPDLCCCPGGLIGLDFRLITAPDSTTAGPQLSRQQSGGAKENCRDGSSCGDDSHDSVKLQCESGECGDSETETGEWAGCDKVSGVFWSVAATFGGSHCVTLVTLVTCPWPVTAMCLVSGPEECGQGEQCGDNTDTDEKNENKSGELSTGIIQDT